MAGDLTDRIDAAIAGMPQGQEREALRATLDQQGAIVRDLAAQNGVTVDEVIEYLRRLSEVKRAYPVPNKN